MSSVAGKRSGVQAEVLYWRTASGQEVDVVLEDRAKRIAGIEIKAAATLSGSDVRGLQALANTAGKNWLRGVVLFAGSEVVPLSSNIHGVPMSRLLDDVSRKPSGKPGTDARRFFLNLASTTNRETFPLRVSLACDAS
jgi:hypothetical protein